MFNRTLSDLLPSYESFKLRTITKTGDFGYLVVTFLITEIGEFKKAAGQKYALFSLDRRNRRFAVKYMRLS